MNNSTQNPLEARVDSNTKIILFCIVLVWSFVGNVLVIATVAANENMRTRFNYLIINMAISDLAVPLVAMPLMIAEETLENKWAVNGAFGNALCKLSYFITDVSPGVSVFSLVVIAANRFFAIVYPMKLKNVSGKKLLCIIGITWICSMAIFAPQLYTFRITTNKGSTICASSWEHLSQDVHVSIFVIVLFIIPLTSIIVLYSIMLYNMRKMSKRVEMMLNNQEARSRERQNKHIFYISIVVIAVFALFWGPFFSLVFVWNFIWHLNVPSYAKLHFKTALFVVQFLGFLNSAINPCVYFVLFKSYREGLKRLFRYGKHEGMPSEMVLQHLNTKFASSIGDNGCRLKKNDNTHV